ncbi:hypothetical protein [Streptomyces sp. NBC_00503]|uniref:hypothetical protein n=1 Tax=Streptomyces sp. NBC_00503 TaxID=2903659 RepID=UPI002E80DB5C|nr:hypothetical protein [Streptomyces sp. NBC_00503]WUD82182.1 hypothetical protein OG490_17425 [Streptomyces sp. NBC_00503]
MDTARGQSNLEFTAALSGGKAFLGRRETRPSNGPYVWKDLTTAANPGFPRNACSVSLGIDVFTAYVKVLTTTGDVYENFCTYTPAGVLTCPSGWTAIVKP